MAGGVSLLPMLFGAAGGVAKALIGGPKAPGAPRPVTRDMAAEAAMQSDDLRRRRGAGANELVPQRLGEARTAGGKVLLGQ